MRLPPTLLVLALLAACRNPQRELAQCKIVAGGVTNVLARCLVTQHDWDPDEAMRAGLIYDASLRAEAMRQEAAAIRLADSLAGVHRQLVKRQSAALRSCIARFMLAYYRNDKDVPEPQGSESPLAAIIRKCSARFPEGAYGELTPGFLDSLAVIAKTP